MANRVLAIIPARGGSRGLPGKNIRLFAGIPLIVHSIRFAKRCPEITRCVVSTDSQEIAAVSKKHEADVPFIRPSELAGDDTPMWPVLHHALAKVETEEGIAYDTVILLDPTSPAREINDVSKALKKLEAAPEADGVIAVSEPDFNAIWHSVIEKDGWMQDLIPEGVRYERRQDAPRVFRINGALYAWRASFVRKGGSSWRGGRHQLLEIPDTRAMSIDTQEEFERAQLLVTSGHIRFPWLDEAPETSCAA